MTAAIFIPLIVTLAIVGVLLWCFNTFLTTIDARIKLLVNVLVILGVLVYAFGQITQHRYGW